MYQMRHERAFVKGQARYAPIPARRPGFERICRPGLVSAGSGPGMIAIVRFFSRAQTVPDFASFRRSLE
jgi:hypothetical protein